MKNTMTLITAALLMMACGKNRNFEALKQGMSTQEVIKSVGEPEQKVPMMMYEWWVYESDNKLVVVNSDTIVNISMDLKKDQEKMKTANEEMKKMLNQ